MEPPPLPHSGSASGRGILSSARASTPSAAMAHAAVTARPLSHAGASPSSAQDLKPHATNYAAATADAPPAGDDVARQLVAELSDAMAASLRQVAAQYGVADAVPASATADLGIGDAASVVRELQRVRRRAAELQLLVDDLQTEQRVARERLALYSILALKLKRELINEKLAHIDSKKEVDEIRQQYESGGGSSVGARSPDASATRSQRPQGASDQRRGSYESPRGSGVHSAEEDDPWSSPNKPSGADGAFGSFYSSRQQPGRVGGGASDAAQRTPSDSAKDEDDEDDDERLLGMQPLRNSLIGQFLPSALLDSPQLTPKARSVASGPRSLDGQSRVSGDDNEDDEANVAAASSDAQEKSEDTQAALARELASFALETEAADKDVRPCDGCGRAGALVAELADCGHRLCRPCDPAVDDPTEQRPPQCPRCAQPVRSVRRLDAAADNQLDHLRIETSRPSSSDSTATAPSRATSTTALTSTTTTIAPMMLSLLSEMFENITVDELEQFLKDAGGQVSGAIERILQRHPAFNPALAAEVSVTAGPGAGSAGQKGGHAPGSLHRAGSSGAPSHQQQSQQQGAGGSAAGSNWKTEMCMYYLQGKCNKTRRTCSFAHGESDLVRTTTPKHTSSTSYKSRMCPLWLEGSCPKSRRECPLAHGENDLRDGLALLGQNAGGAAGGGAAGAGGVQAPTLPTTAPRLQNYKTELCYYYLKGCCNFTKEECRFAHGESDLRTVESNTLEWSAQLGVAGLGPDKSALAHQHQHQHQYQHQHQPSQQQQQHQQQYVQQYQSQPPQHQQVPQQPAMPQHAQYGLTPLPAPFVPQAHQQYHQMAAQAMHPHQLPGGPMPPALQPSPYGQHQPPYRYMKSMDDAKPPRRPAPPRRESTWSQPSYDSLGPDF